jgi:endonuclease III
MSGAAALCRRALDLLGPHAAAQAGLDLSAAGDRTRWLVLSRLLSGRAREEVALAAFARLSADPGAAPEQLVAAGPARVGAALGAAGLAKPDPVAAVLCRAAASLCDRHRGSLDALAAQCDGLEELGSQLAALAPGLGTATVLRFLRPLRDAWTGARETPLAEPARAAAVHVGLLGASEDLEGEPAALRAACARWLPDLSPVDVEAALERLGALSCRARRIERCPLGDACPV